MTGRASRCGPGPWKERPNQPRDVFTTLLTTKEEHWGGGGGGDEEGTTTGTGDSHPLVERQCHCHFLSFLLLVYLYIYIFFLTFKLHPTSLVISRVIFKLAKNWMIIYQHTIYCKLSNKYIFCCSWEFFFSSFLSHFETKHQSCTATASNVNTGLLSNEAWSRLLLWHPHGTAEEFRKWAQATACCYGNTGSLINMSFVGGEKMGMNNLHIR